MCAKTVEQLAEEVAAKRVSRRKWRTIKSWAGRQQVTADQREELQRDLEAHGLYPRPAIDMSAPSADTFIVVSAHPYEKWEHGFRFAKEADLRAAVLANRRHLRQFADLYAVSTEASLTDSRGKRRRIDMLAKRPSRDSSKNHWVLVEFERQDGHNETGSQLLGYLKEFRAHRAAEADTVELMVVSQAVDEQSYKQLRDACEDADVKFSWLVTSMELVEATPDL